MIGQTLSHYRITAALGAGGMGEVYRATDKNLNRDVAIKVLPPEFAKDQERLSRFRREAHLLASLNHPNIAAIYGLEEADGKPFLALELVEGEDLKQRLLKGAIPADEALEIAEQIAEALEEAHSKGIVHRDLKPANVKLAPDGKVKVLDFGLAKQNAHKGRSGSAGLSGQLTADVSEANLTSPGAAIGTVAYMSPEQALGEELDARTDLFSLGVVLYEMLTGKNPFLAPSFVATTDRILHKIPDSLSNLNPSIPASLERIVSKTLAKEVDDRYASANELLSDLRALERGKGLPSAISWPLPRRAFQSAWVAVAVVAVLVIILLLTSVPSVRESIGRRLGLVTVPDQKRVVVLPFSALGGGKEATAFANGLTETLNVGLSRLTKRRSLQVVPPSEVHVEGVTTIDEARRAFGVNLVITGTLRVSGKTARVNYTLWEAGSEQPLDADTITAAATDPFKVEDRVVTSVIDALEISLQPRERAGLAAHGTRDTDAYASYLKGRGYLQDYPKLENVDNAIDAFRHSLEKDPQYSLAYAGLGAAYWQKYLHSKEPLWVTQALAACGRAVTLGPGFSNGHTCLGVVYSETGNYEMAVEQFLRAVELEPTSDAAYRGLADAYERLGRPKEAERTYRQAISLRPQYWAGYNWLGAFYYMQGRYAEAAEMFLKAVELAPGSFRGYSNLGATYDAQGHYAEAIRASKRSAAIRPTADAYSNLGTAYFYQRQFAEAAKAYEKAARMEPQEYLWWGNLGDARYWAPRQHAQAATAYEQAVVAAKEKLRVNPRDARTLGYLAYYYAMLDNKQMALSSTEQALTLSPNDPELRFNAALTYNKLGQTEQALEWLEKALAIGIKSAIVRDNPFIDNLRMDHRYLRLLQRHQSQ